MLDWLLTHTPLFYLVQSFWRDEAFSVLTAEKPLASVIGSLNFEPPFYYILLHIWIRIFGESEIAARSLSLVGFSLATCVVILWAEKRFRSHWLSWIFPVLFFINPMLLYYGFEVRAYGWFMFFSTLSLFAYGQKKYWLTALANILGFYTHSYAIFIPFVQCLHYLLSSTKKEKKYFQSLILTGISIAPWFIPIYEEAKKMRPTWYYPVDLQLVRSVLGNMFTGYDGTPGGLWSNTFILSIILLGVFYLAFKIKEQRREISYFLFMIFLPLFIVIGISFIKPLFVNRYLIYVSIAEMFLVGYALFSIKNSLLQKMLTLFVFLFMIYINIYFPQHKAKLDIRSTIIEANLLKGPNDLIYVSSPLIFFETVYYSKDRSNVYLYNPDHGEFPWYVGETAFSQSQMAYDLPEYPKRAIFIGLDRSITISYKMNTPQTLNTTAQEK